MTNQNQNEPTQPTVDFTDKAQLPTTVEELQDMVVMFAGNLKQAGAQMEAMGAEIDRSRYFVGLAQQEVDICLKLENLQKKNMNTIKRVDKLVARQEATERAQQERLEKNINNMNK